MQSRSMFQLRSSSKFGGITKPREIRCVGNMFSNSNCAQTSFWQRGESVWKQYFNHSSTLDAVLVHWVSIANPGCYVTVWKLGQQGSMLLSREKRCILSKQCESMLSFTRCPLRPVDVPEQAVLTLSRTRRLWKGLPVVGDSWIPFNPDDFIT